jgi:hypothetical protein
LTKPLKIGCGYKKGKAGLVQSGFQKPTSCACLQTSYQVGEVKVEKINKTNKKMLTTEDRIFMCKEIWYTRNPVHEENDDTGEDMFWGTLAMCFYDWEQLRVAEAKVPLKERINELVKENDEISKERNEWGNNNMLLAKKVSELEFAAKFNAELMLKRVEENERLQKELDDCISRCKIMFL